MAPEFKSFSEIENISKLKMSITQKIHGSNAQIYIYKDSFQGLNEPRLPYSAYLNLICGSRSRWIYPDDDNYGFAAFVHTHKEEFIEKLGEGRHYGEWAGPGINTGEGLEEKTFVLFNWWDFPPARSLPPQTIVVPVLYDGSFDFSKIDEVMEDLKTNGSKLMPDYAHPEGIVISIGKERFKKVFKPEETKWDNKRREPKELKPHIDYSHLLQAIRLEKLLSRDEKYVADYPKSLSLIVKDYVADLIKEEQIFGTEDEIKAMTKGASGQIFAFVKDVMEGK